ncbi:hypothetical protein QYF36_020315 [Acer negundo]|nr:hypothetical protein QYF36_020315 [Acer negundo]
MCLGFVVNVLPSPRAVTVSVSVDVVVVASNCGRLCRRYRLLSASSQEFIASLRRLGQAENAWLSLFPLTTPNPAELQKLVSIQVANNRSRGLLKLYPRVQEALKRTLLPFRRKLVQLRLLHKLLCFQKQRGILQLNC